MDKCDSVKYTIRLSFEDLIIPPFQDIVILGRHVFPGKVGLSKSFELLVPDHFDLFEVNDERVEAVFINKKLLIKMGFDKIVEVLRTSVFPFISDGEILKVDFKVTFSYSQIEAYTVSATDRNGLNRELTDI